MIRRNPDIAVGILLVGGIAYALLCGPAIVRRGYPPIDPLWMAMPLLWVSPLCLSAIFDDPRRAARRRQVACYAFATAFFHAATMGGVTPRNVDLIGTACFALFLYGPVHLAVAVVLESVMLLILRPASEASDPESTVPRTMFPKISLRAWLVGFTVICITLGFPSAFRRYMVQGEIAAGRERAEEDWAKEAAVVFATRDVQLDSGVIVSYRFDAATGLELQHRRPDHGYRDAYNQRIRELLEERGDPPWSLKSRIPAAEDLADLLKTDTLSQIRDFPHKLTPSMTIARSGGASLSEDNGFYVQTKNSGHTGIGYQVKRVFVGMSDEDPDLYIIRSDKDWVGLFHRDGRWVASASRW
jgi:hypothetical protein